MDISQINLLGVLVATVIGMMLGALWYSPAALGNAWMASINKTPDTLGSQTAPMIGSIVACLLTATGLALLHSAMVPSGAVDAISLGLVVGLLLIFPALLSDNLFCGWGSKLLMIQSGYRVLCVVLMSCAIFYVQAWSQR